MSLRTTALLTFIAHTLALADPLVTAAAQLAPRDVDPSLVGYISAAGGFSDSRTCDYPQTVSTSGSYVQCCPTSGACPFYTSCSGNTLLAAGATVPCDVNTALTCNTAVVLPTAGAANGGQYLACWQKTLGSSPFTFVQDIGSASVAAATTTTGSASSASTGTSSSSRASSTSASSGSTQTSTRSSSAGASTSATAASTSASSNAATGGASGLSGGLAGAMALLAQILL